MVEAVSPLEPVWKPGRHGNAAAGAGVTLSETRPGSIVQIAAFPGAEAAVLAALDTTTGLAFADDSGAGAFTDRGSAFGVGPRRWLAVEQAEGLAARLSPSIASTDGAVTDLSHARTAIRVDGPRAEWVLAKLFALDLSAGAFPVGFGRATQHHDVLAHIQRTGPHRFDLLVFRSLARSFWIALCHASEEVGYEVR